MQAINLKIYTFSWEPNWREATIQVDGTKNMDFKWFLTSGIVIETRIWLTLAWVGARWLISPRADRFETIHFTVEHFKCITFIRHSQSACSTQSNQPSALDSTISNDSPISIFISLEFAATMGKSQTQIWCFGRANYLSAMNFHEFFMSSWTILRGFTLCALMSNRRSW